MPSSVGMRGERAAETGPSIASSTAPRSGDACRTRRQLRRSALAPGRRAPRADRRSPGRWPTLSESVDDGNPRWRALPERGRSRRVGRLRRTVPLSLGGAQRLVVDSAHGDPVAAAQQRSLERSSPAPARPAPQLPAARHDGSDSSDRRSLGAGRESAMSTQRPAPRFQHARRKSSWQVGVGRPVSRGVGPVGCGAATSRPPPPWRRCRCTSPGSGTNAVQPVVLARVEEPLPQQRVGGHAAAEAQALGPDLGRGPAGLGHEHVDDRLLERRGHVGGGDVGVLADVVDRPPSSARRSEKSSPRRASRAGTGSPSGRPHARRRSMAGPPG